MGSGAFGRMLAPLSPTTAITFLRRPPQTKLDLPIELDGARILRLDGREIFTAYVPSPRGAVFMQLIEKTFGTEVTTRTLDTIKKVAGAARQNRDTSNTH